MQNKNWAFLTAVSWFFSLKYFWKSFFGKSSLLMILLIWMIFFLFPRTNSANFGINEAIKILGWSAVFIEYWSKFSNFMQTWISPHEKQWKMQDGKRTCLRKLLRLHNVCRDSVLTCLMPSNQIILEAELSQEFCNIVDIYRNQKINNRIQIGLCIFQIMTATISSKLGFSSMLVTLLLVTATLVYLAIS